MRLLDMDGVVEDDDLGTDESSDDEDEERSGCGRYEERRNADETRNCLRGRQRKHEKHVGGTTSLHGGTTTEGEKWMIARNFADDR